MPDDSRDKLEPTSYRVFQISPMGKINGPPHTIEADSDSDALRQARQLVDGHAVELWQRSRLVATIDPVDRHSKA